MWQLGSLESSGHRGLLVVECIPKVQALVESYCGRCIARNTEIEKLEGPRGLDDGRRRS